MRILLFLLLPLTMSLYSQQKITKSFTFEGNAFEYSTYRPNKTVNVLKFYVILLEADEETSLQDGCPHDFYKRLYFLTIPEGFNKQEKERFFQEFVFDITDRTKLLESEMIVIAPDDYTALYRETAIDNYHPKEGYLNTIKSMYIYQDTSEVCDFIK